jgi:hypothetical protein
MATPGMSNVVSISLTQVLQEFQTAQAAKIQTGLAAVDVPQADFVQHMGAISSTYKIPETATSVLGRSYALPTIYLHAPILAPAPPVHPAPISLHPPLAGPLPPAPSVGFVGLRPVAITLAGTQAFTSMVQLNHNEVLAIFQRHVQAVTAAANVMGTSNNTAAFLQQLNALRLQAIQQSNAEIDALYQRGINLAGANHEQAARILVSHNQFGIAINTIIGDLFGVHSTIGQTVQTVAKVTAAIVTGVVQEAGSIASKAADAVGSAVKSILSIF